MTPSVKPQWLEIIVGVALTLTLGLVSLSRADSSVYNEINLVSDLSTVGAATVDPNLKNPWGIAFSPTGPFWVANAGTSTATIYNITGRESRHRWWSIRRGLPLESSLTERPAFKSEYHRQPLSSRR